jgi:hypothetical protein
LGDDEDPNNDTRSKTEYVIDASNPTGYAQVLEAWNKSTSGARSLSRSYEIGLDILAQVVSTSVGYLLPL